MMEQPNLIKRPILIRGIEGRLRVRQGSKNRPGEQDPHRDVRLELPVRQGTWNGIFYPVPPGRRLAGAGGSTSCGSTPSTSTRSR
jgi:hypothetical protein